MAIYLQSSKLFTSGVNVYRMSVKLTGPYKSCKGFRDMGYLCNKLTEKRYLREKVMGYKDQIKQEPSGEIPNFCNWDK